MFRRKAEKRIVELTHDEVRLMREALLAFRNKADKSDTIILKSCCFTKSQSAKQFRPALPKILFSCSPHLSSIYCFP